MSSRVSWYFDFISPYAYLQQCRFAQFPAALSIEAIPVLFAGLLNHWQQKGPAEIPPRRIFTYQQVSWLGRKLGVPLRMPPAHPFVPLRALRLAIALDNDRAVIAQIFNYIWRDGRDIDDDKEWYAFTAALGVDDARSLVEQPRVKQQLRRNTDAAIAAGVFGVPTLLADGHLFWGNDASEMFLDYLARPDLFDDAEMLRIQSLPAAATRIPVAR